NTLLSLEKERVLPRLAIVPVALLSAVAVPARLGPGRAAFASIDTTRADVVVVPFNPERDLRYYLEIKTSPERRKEGFAAAKEANAFAAKGQYRAALASYTRAEKLLPALGDWISVVAAGVAASVGDTAEVNRRLSEQDSLIATDWGWRTRVRALRAANDSRRALELAQAAADADGSPRRRSQAWVAIGEIKLEQGDMAAARQAFTSAIDAWPYSDPAMDATRFLADLPGLQAEHYLRIGRT